eukprot:8198509-Lingulodinium_polyedra.AAC.1
MDIGPWADQEQRARVADTHSSGSPGSACASDGAGAQRLRGQQGADHRAAIVPPCPAVALYGRAIVKSLVAGWWGRWAGRSTSKCPIKTELSNIAKSAEGAVPSCILHGWIARHGVQ